MIEAVQCSVQPYLYVIPNVLYIYFNGCWHFNHCDTKSSAHLKLTYHEQNLPHFLRKC